MSLSQLMIRFRKIARAKWGRLGRIVNYDLRLPGRILNLVKQEVTSYVPTFDEQAGQPKESRAGQIRKVRDGSLQDMTNVTL